MSNKSISPNSTGKVGSNKLSTNMLEGIEWNEKCTVCGETAEFIDLFFEVPVCSEGCSEAMFVSYVNEIKR